MRELAPSIPQGILTNAVHLGESIVQENLRDVEKVIVKWDAGHSKVLKAINRPISGVSLPGILRGIKSFQKNYTGELEVQTMLMFTTRRSLPNSVSTCGRSPPDGFN